MSKDDLTVAGPGSPVSMAKFIAKIDSETPREKQAELMLILCNDGIGIHHDEPTLVNVMIADRVIQAEYWRDNFWNGKQISAYLFRWIYWVMEEDCNKNPKYPTNQSVADAFNSGALTETSDDWIKIRNYLEWMKSNTEITHLVGLIQLVGGSLKQASSKQSYLRFFIEQPETGFHPKRERLLGTILHKLSEEYGFNPVKQLSDAREEIYKDESEDESNPQTQGNKD